MYFLNFLDLTRLEHSGKVVSKFPEPVVDKHACQASVNVYEKLVGF